MADENYKDLNYSWPLLDQQEDSTNLESSSSSTSVVETSPIDGSSCTSSSITPPTSSGSAVHQRGRWYTIHDIPSDVLVWCLSFLGEGYYRYIGGTSIAFKRAYLMTHIKHSTTMESVTSSMSCVELYLHERRDAGQIQMSSIRSLCYGSASQGNLHILQWSFELGTSELLKIRQREAIEMSQSRYPEKTYPHIHLVERELKREWGPKIFRHALRNNHVSIVQWAQTQNFKRDDVTGIIAPSYGARINHNNWQ